MNTQNGAAQFQRANMSSWSLKKAVLFEITTQDICDQPDEKGKILECHIFLIKNPIVNVKTQIPRGNPTCLVNAPQKVFPIL